MLLLKSVLLLPFLGRNVFFVPHFLFSSPTNSGGEEKNNLSISKMHVFFLASLPFFLKAKRPDTKTPRHLLDTQTPRHLTPRHQVTQTPRHLDTQTLRHSDTQTPRHPDTQKTPRRHPDTQTLRLLQTPHQTLPDTLMPAVRNSGSEEKGSEEKKTLLHIEDAFFCSHFLCSSPPNAQTHNTPRHPDTKIHRHPDTQAAQTPRHPDTQTPKHPDTQTPRWPRHPDA